MKAETGQYLHRSFSPDAEIHWLSDLRLDVDRNSRDKGGEATWVFTEQSKTSEGRAHCLERAASLYNDAYALASEFKEDILRPGGDFVDRDPGLYARGPTGDADAVDWMDRFFVFPSDALRLLDPLMVESSVVAQSEIISKKRTTKRPSMIATTAYSTRNVTNSTQSDGASEQGKRLSISIGGSRRESIRSLVMERRASVTGMGSG